MLIQCPECGKEISDKSPQCIHCGCPISTDHASCKINNIKYDLSQELQMILDNTSLAYVVMSLRMKCGLSLKDAKRLYDIINETHEIPASFVCDVPSINVLKCPKCGSTAVSTTARGWKWTTGFIGSNQTVNRCGNCGNTWKP